MARPVLVDSADLPAAIEPLGYRLHPMTKTELLDTIFRTRGPGCQIVLASANLHGLYLHERDAAYGDLHRRDNTIVIIDGMPVVWLSQLLGHPVTRDHRTTWLDWFEDALFRAAETGTRVFVLGHSKPVLDAGLAKARLRWPDLAIDGCDGFFDMTNPATCDVVVNRINAYAPGILFVGMGMPRQEAFAAAHASSIRAPVVALGGAAFAYFAGEQKRPPRWMGRVGAEWAHRLISNPLRLGHRYLLEPVLLAYAVTVRLLARHVILPPPRQT